jgi:anti-anti-sigma regulatory factor
MYKIEQISENQFYVKLMGDFFPDEAKDVSNDFLQKVKNSKKINVIIDMLDLVLIRLSSLKILIELLNNTKKKLERSAYVISFNPPLSEELKYVLNKSKSPNRKVVHSLDEGKEWTGITEIKIRPP